MRFIVIANPVAGRGLAQASLPKLEDELKLLGISYDLKLTDSPNHASLLAAQAENYEGIIAVGGDGTINEVVNGMPKDKPLCVVPLGTGNDLARSLKIPFGLESLKTITQGKIKAINMGLENEGLFVSSVALGLASDVMQRVNSKRNHRLIRGSLAIYLDIVASAFGLKPLTLRIEADDKVREVKSILTYVMNTPYTGGGLFLAPKANPTDHLLDVVIVRDTKGFEILKLLPGVYSGKHVNHPHVEFLRAKNVTITSLEPAPKMIDGEIKGYTPLKASVSTENLLVYQPS